MHPKAVARRSHTLQVAVAVAAVVAAASLIELDGVQVTNAQPVPEAELLRTVYGNTPSLAWSPDGTRLAFNESWRAWQAPSDDTRRGLYLYNTQTQSVDRLAFQQRYHPAWLGNQRLVAVCSEFEECSQGAYLYTVSGNESTLASTDTLHSQALSDTEVAIYAMWTHGPTAWRRINVETGTVSWEPTEAGGWDRHPEAIDQCVQSVGDTRVWLNDEAGLFSQVGDADPVHLSSAMPVFFDSWIGERYNGLIQPCLSPDGRRVAYYSQGTPDGDEYDTCPTCNQLSVFVVPGSEPADTTTAQIDDTQTIGCDLTAQALTGDPGTLVDVTCPAGCASASVWGSDIYSDDSSVCAAAIHAGVIGDAEGGVVQVTITGGQGSYAASVRNGVTSQPWGAWSRSFTVAGAGTTDATPTDLPGLPTSPTTPTTPTIPTTPTTPTIPTTPPVPTTPTPPVPTTPTTPPELPPLPGQGGGTLCSDTCESARDTECDDGGPGSMYNVCAYGTDCADCGPRDPAMRNAGPPPRPDGMLCSDACGTSHDRECDDGGPGSLYDICSYGTDCSDCGPRPPR